MLSRLFSVIMLLGALCAAPAAAAERQAVFAGGCFWSIQKLFDHVPGVVRTHAGFMGGSVANPSYDQVARRGGTGHLEAVEVIYDPAKVSYEALLEAFWHNIDPTDSGGQICDRGPTYQTAVFTFDDAQFASATASRDKTARTLGKPVATRIIRVSSLRLKAFYPAEDYHQAYWRTHPVSYERYAIGCGRERKLRAVWGRHYQPPPWSH